MKRYGLLIGLLCLLAAWVGCAGVKPNPRYTENGETERGRRNGRDGDAPRSRPARVPEEQRIMQQIEAYLGVPYRWGGSTRAGMDCSGFVSTVYSKAANLDLPHKARLMYGLGVFVPKDALQFGDLVFFEKIESRGVSHVGIYVGAGKFAHASTTRGVVISKLNETYYRKRYVGARRVR